LREIRARIRTWHGTVLVALRVYRSVATMDKSALLPPLAAKGPAGARPQSSAVIGSSKSWPSGSKAWLPICETPAADYRPVSFFRPFRTLGGRPSGSGGRPSTVRTGAKERRCMAQAPSLLRAARCSGMDIPCVLRTRSRGGRCPACTSARPARFSPGSRHRRWSGSWHRP
jgi:hypothetical protein